MGFGSIKGFVDGFKTGYNLIPDLTQEQKDERAIEKRRKENEANQADQPATPTKDYTQSDQPVTGSRYRDAVGSVESSNRYDAVGPTSAKYGRPLGKYQVMESNLPSWSKEAIGREVSPEEYLKTPEIQDKVFDVQFGKSLSRTGNANDAISIWHSGVPLAQAQGRKDSLGTRTPDYVSRVNKALGSGAATVPVVGRQAALDVDDEDAVDENGNRVRPGIYAASGGLVEDDEQAITGPASSGMSNEESTSRQGGGSPAAPTREVRQSDIVDASKVGRAVDDGMKYIQSIFGFNQPTAIMGASQQHQDGIQAFARNVGAATPEEVQAVDQTIDPHGRLSAEKKALGRLNAGYDYYMEKGQPGRAQQYAASMLMYVKKNIADHGALAQAALEDNNVKAGAEAIAGGKDGVPDGETVKVGKVGPDGAEFQAFDADGRPTTKGKATVDQMMKIAHGMQDGSAWLEQIGAIKGKSAIDKRTEKRQVALDAFNKASLGKEDEKGFMASLSDEERAAFPNLDPNDQQRLRREFANRTSEERKQANVDRRYDYDLENRDYKRDLTEFQETVKQGRWEDQRMRSMTQFERSLAEKKRENDDRNTRQELSQEARDKRNQEIDKRIMETRDERQRTAKNLGLGPKTAGERADTEVQKQANSALGDIADSPEPASETGPALPIGRTTTPDPASGELPQPLPLPGDVQGTENYGPTPQQYERMQAVQAGSAYAQSANDRKTNARDIETFRKDKEDIGAAFTKAWAGAAKPPNEGQMRQLTSIASNIVEANGTQYTPQDAVDLVKKAVDPKVTPRVLANGTVQFDPTMTPVKISEEAMMQLAMLRRQAQKEQTGTGGAKVTTGDARGASAIPGVSGNPVRRDPSDRGRDDTRRRGTSPAALDEKAKYALDLMTPEERARAERARRYGPRGGIVDLMRTR